jgi:hypothetical protein
MFFEIESLKIKNKTPVIKIKSPDAAIDNILVSKVLSFNENSLWLTSDQKEGFLPE